MYFLCSGRQNTQKLPVNFGPAEFEFNEVGQCFYRETCPAHKSSGTTGGVFSPHMIVYYLSEIFGSISCTCDFSTLSDPLCDVCHSCPGVFGLASRLFSWRESRPAEMCSEEPQSEAWGQSYGPATDGPGAAS